MFQFLRKKESDILRYLPSFLAKDKVFKEIADDCSKEHEKIRLQIIDLAKQFFVSTATWGLDDWERVLAITTMKSDSYSIRRNRILLKLQGCQTSTIDFMKTLINRYMTEYVGDIIEYNSENRFEIVVDSDKVISYKEMIKAIDTYKPAHLAMYLAMLVYQKINLHQSANVMEFVESKHRIWNLGGTKKTYWNAEYNLDTKIRLDGIVPGQGYKERQAHQAKIKISVDSHQKNDCRNVFDGGFCMDGSHTLNGAWVISGKINHCCILESSEGVEVQ